MLVLPCRPPHRGRITIAVTGMTCAACQSFVQRTLESQPVCRTQQSICAAQAIRTGSVEERQAMYDELLGIMYKNAR
jgi:cation transport ATPase